jgi:hypothetical protein
VIHGQAVLQTRRARPVVVQKAMMRKFSCGSDIACACSATSSEVFCFCALDINFPDGAGVSKR